MSEQRFSQTYRDSRSLLVLSSVFSTQPAIIGSNSIVKAAEWFDFDSETRLMHELSNQGTHSVIIHHVELELRARIAANPVLTFIGMVEQSCAVKKALEQAPVWAIENRVRLQPKRRVRCEQALRAIYEFPEHFEEGLKKLMEVA